MLIEQHASLPIENLDFFANDEHSIRHSILFPNHLRMVFSGPSGSGKTNALLSLLFNPNGIRYENIYIYSKSLFQPKYQLLEEVMKKIPEIGYFKFSDNEDIIDPSEACENSFFIFDDVVFEKQEKIQKYYCMSRHKNIDLVFLVQSYITAKKKTRDNFNLISLFRQDDVNLKHAFDEHVSPDMSYDTFKQLCSMCWNSSDYGFITIVKDFPLDKGRYRIGFDKYIKL